MKASEKPITNDRFHESVWSGSFSSIGFSLGVSCIPKACPYSVVLPGGAGYLHNPQIGLFITAAILLHNIPEGIATALPLCKGGVRRRDALIVALLSGLAEPAGALLASLFLVSFQNLVPGALAFAGGVMVFITLDELIPTAREYGHEHYTAIGIIIGSLFVFILSGVFGV